MHAGLLYLTLVALLAATEAVTPTPAAAVHWAPAGIASDQFESHPAFDPLTGDFYFVRSSTEFKGWRILTSRCRDGHWSQPVDAAFAGDGVEADPYFTADGRTVYFISTRSTDGIKRKDLDIWRVTRDASDAWAAPERLPEPINSPGQEWFPRPARDGWLYFGSDRPGGQGRTDIWRARQVSGKWTVENLGSPVNTAGHEYEPLPAADGHRLIIMANDGLYESRLQNGAWSAKKKLGLEINVNGSEIGALLSPSGKSLLFARDLGKAHGSGEFFVWHESEEAWPHECR